MSWFNRLFSSTPAKGPCTCLLNLNELDSPSLQDTISSIDELSLAVHNNPDAVEIYLALGNLYRSKGELEQAAHIRNNIILRPGLDEKFKARAWFELGVDYRRAGLLDKALAAFNEAKKISSTITGLNKQLAQLAEDRGDFGTAAEYYKEMGQNIPQAHAMVRLAQKYFEENKPYEGRNTLSQALEIFSGAPDAWLLTLWQAWLYEDHRLPELLNQAMSAICNDMRFILIEAFFEKIEVPRPGPAEIKAKANNEGESGPQPPESDDPRRQNLIRALSAMPDDLLPDYHLARIYMNMRDYIKAKEHFNRCLLITSDFWPAHLELLYLAIITEKIPPLLKRQLEFFMSRKRRLDSFYCRQCGLRYGQVFFLCPKCRTWYSAALCADLYE